MNFVHVWTKISQVTYISEHCMTTWAIHFQNALRLLMCYFHLLLSIYLLHPKLKYIKRMPSCSAASSWTSEGEKITPWISHKFQIQQIITTGCVPHLGHPFVRMKTLSNCIHPLDFPEISCLVSIHIRHMTIAHGRAIPICAFFGKSSPRRMQWAIA